MLTDKQKNELIDRTKKYKEIYNKINELENQMKLIQEDVSSSLNELDNIRKQEKKWTKKNSKLLNITENDFLNYCKLFLENEYNN